MSEEEEMAKIACIYSTSADSGQPLDVIAAAIAAGPLEITQKPEPTKSDAESYKPTTPTESPAILGAASIPKTPSIGQQLT